MGAWGPGPFDNDSALDWIADVLDAEAGWELVLEVLDGVASADEADPDMPIDADDGSAALAAAELVAARYGRPLEHTPADILDFVRAVPGPLPAEDRAIAATAVRRVMSASELAELWEGDPEWISACEHTLARLDVAEG